MSRYVTTGIFVQPAVVIIRNPGILPQAFLYNRLLSLVQIQVYYQGIFAQPAVVFITILGIWILSNGLHTWKSRYDHRHLCTTGCCLYYKFGYMTTGITNAFIKVWVCFIFFHLQLTGLEAYIIHNGTTNQLLCWGNGKINSQWDVLRYF